MKAYGCDGIYLDQLASAEPFACYCEAHSHDDIGEFNNGYVYVLRELFWPGCANITPRRIL